MHCFLKKSMSWVCVFALMLVSISISSCKNKLPAEGDIKSFHSASNNDIVFSIKDISISKAEVMEEVERRKPPGFDQDMQTMSSEEARNIMDEFIVQSYNIVKSRVLFQVYAKENNIDLTVEEIENATNELKAMIENNWEQSGLTLEEILDQNNVSYETFLKDIRYQALQDKVMQPFFDKIDITEEELDSYYEQNYDRYNLEEGAHMHLITLHSRAEADEAFNEIMTGADFHVIAKRYESPSESGSQAPPGDIGPIPRSGIPPPLVDDIFNRERPLMTPFLLTLDAEEEVYFIVRIKEFIAEQLHLLETIKDSVTKDIMDEKKMQEIEKFINNLEKVYIVKILIAPPASPYANMMQQMPPMP